MVMKTTRPVCESSMEHRVARLIIARPPSAQAVEHHPSAPSEAIDPSMSMLATAVPWRAQHR